MLSHGCADFFLLLSNIHNPHGDTNIRVLDPAHGSQNVSIDASLRLMSFSQQAETPGRFHHN
jgi:hypothetical protein